MNAALVANARTILSSAAFQQLAPLAVVLLVPLLVLSARTPASAFARFAQMVFSYITSLLGWNAPPAGGSSSPKKLRKKHGRSRAGGYANGDANGDAQYDEGYYPGIVNISGTYCFMDSTLQAFASLTYLQPYLDNIHDQAEGLDVPTPIADALRDLLIYLNTPKSNPMPLRPHAMIAALSQHSARKQNLFGSREHQDAQELFQLVSECVKDEALAVVKESRRDKGFGGLPPLDAALDSAQNGDLAKNVFDGLTANRRSCTECGYTEAVMHFGFDSWQLAVPRSGRPCHLEDCIAEYTKLEMLTDCMCRKCSLVATHRRLVVDAVRLSEAAEAEGGASHSKRKRAREARKLEGRVREALEAGRIEEDVKGVTLERVFSRASTKQAMIARPPPVLALHLNRSIHYGHYAGKNTARVIFPELLDLTTFTTSGTISTQPYLPISSSSTSIDAPGTTPFYAREPLSTPPAPAAARPETAPRTLYRLAAVVCHYGAHSFGHYVCYRRKPRPPSTGAKRFEPPRLACPLGCECAACVAHGPVRDGSEQEPGKWGGGGWLRISDDEVREVPLQSVLAEAEGAFMLYYERVRTPAPAPSPPPLGGRVGQLAMHEDARSSEETVRPRDVLEEGTDERRGLERMGSVPRVVRAVAVGRGRSFSPALVASASMESVLEAPVPLPPAPEPPLAPEDGETEVPVPKQNGLVVQAPAIEAAATVLPNGSARSRSPARSASARSPSESPSKARRKAQRAAQNGSARSPTPTQKMGALPAGLQVQ